MRDEIAEAIVSNKRGKAPVGKDAERERRQPADGGDGFGPGLDDAAAQSDQPARHDQG